MQYGKMYCGTLPAKVIVEVFRSETTYKGAELFPQNSAASYLRRLKAPDRVGDLPLQFVSYVACTPWQLSHVIR